jgi:hypothetical protein
MRTPVAKAVIWVISILVAGLAGLLTSSGLARGPSNPGCDEGVNLQIMTDQTSYSPGAIMHVKFLITNTAKTPLYLFRGIGQCSSQHGWLSLQLRDLHNKEVEVEGWECSADDFSMNTLDMVRFLSSPETGVLLQQGEIYGREADYNLPKKKGTFRLHLELAPAGFLTEEQKQALSQHQMRVLHSPCLAPAVTITVK